jgi:hypothetical protein
MNVEAVPDGECSVVVVQNTAEKGWTACGGLL